ncbi:MAG: hypothetical protein ACFCVF_05845 [Kineosporiaceae bacterium]
MRPPSRGPLVAAVAAAVAVLALSGCGLAEQAGERVEQEAQERVDAAVDQAVEGAADRVEQELAEQGVVATAQAQDLLQQGLDELEASGAVCSGYALQPEDQRRDQMGSLLRAFWLAELETSTPSADVVGAYTGDVDTRCEASPDATLATVAREAYDSGSFSPGAG